MSKVEITDQEIVIGDEAEAIDTYLKSMERDAFFRGSVIVIKKGKTILSKGYGFAASRIKATPATLFQIGSLTKQFTAAAILKLSEMGKLALDDPINPYLSGQYGLELDQLDKWKDITVHHLLAHTSGIPNYTDSDEYYKVSKKLTTEKIIQWARKQELSFKPGTDFEYSNTGYILLGAIIEKQSGLTYDAFIKQELLIPAEMDSSGVSIQNDHPDPQVAIGYCLDKRGESLTEDKSENISATFSDGAMYSTVKDLSKWSLVLEGYNNVLSKKTIQMMTTPGRGAYGLGLEISEFLGHKMIHHSGSIAGFKSDFCKFPNEDIFISVLCNNIDFDAMRITSDICKLLFKKEKKMPEAIAFPDDFDFTPFLGVFVSEADEDNEIEFFLNNRGRLFIDGTPPTGCILLSNGHLFNPSLGFEYELKKNGDITVYDVDGNQVDTLREY